MARSLKVPKGQAGSLALRWTYGPNPKEPAGQVEGVVQKVRVFSGLRLMTPEPRFASRTAGWRGFGVPPAAPGQRAASRRCRRGGRQSPTTRGGGFCRWCRSSTLAAGGVPKWWNSPQPFFLSFPGETPFGLWSKGPGFWLSPSS